METIKPKEVSGSGQESRGQKTGNSVDDARSDAQRQLARMAAAQGAPVVRNVTDLAVEFWPDDESADDINHYIYRQRHRDRTQA